jgi:hypothetical protein
MIMMGRGLRPIGPLAARRTCAITKFSGTNNHSMNSCRIILPLVVLCGCKPWTPQQYQTNPPPVVIQEYPTTGVPAVVPPQLATGGELTSGPFAGPPYMQTGPVLVGPTPGGGTILPPHSTIVPLPSHTPGSIFGPPIGAQAPAGTPNFAPPPYAGPLADIAPGGMVSPQLGLPAGPDAMGMLTSSISVPVTNDEWAWDQITDVVGNYFTISIEQPVRRGEVITEGRIETAPQDGATWFEPHRNDSVGRFNRWESTFQTIRRRALVRALPDASGYTIEITVEKELEDLPRPERATAGSATFRNDGSLPSDRAEQVNHTRTSPRWISMGRDPPLEQRILAEIHARLTGAATIDSPVFRQ